MSTISKDAVCQVLRAAVEKAGTQKAFADRYGLGQQYVSEVLRGTRSPSPRVLDALGLVKVTSYAPVQETAQETV